MSRAAGRWRSSCVPARRRPAPRSATLLKHLTRRIRRHWPRTRLTFRGDSHYGRREAMDWCEAKRRGTTSSDWRAMRRCTASPTRPATISRCAAPRPARTGCAASPASITPPVRGGRKRRVAARLEATPRGFEARYIVTSLAGQPRHLYEGVYCARGQAENLIKLHKVQLASDRTSCQSPLANQFRLVLHTAAYWLMLAPARCGAAQDAAPLVRVRHHPPEPAQDRRPRRRKGRPHPHPLRLGLPRRRPVPTAGRPARDLGTLTAGAPCPAKPRPFNPQPRYHKPKSRHREGAERKPLRAQNQTIQTTCRE